jgi:type VI secretion system protein ImpE
LQTVHAHTDTLTGKINGVEFVSGRDLDDVVSGYFEVLTTNGKFYWLAMDKVIRIDFREYERLQDRIWRSGTIRVEGFHTDGEVYFPVCYCCDPVVWSSQTDDQIRLGRKTDWYAATPHGPVRGMGQKLFVFGDQEYSIMELESFEGPNFDAD